MRRASERISPKASSAVGYGSPEVPQTVTPRSAAAFMSMEALRMPAVMRSLSLGRRSSSARVNGVRSRMAMTMSKSPSRAASLSWSAMWSGNATTSVPAGRPFQSAMRIATFW